MRPWVDPIPGVGFTELGVGWESPMIHSFSARSLPLPFQDQYPLDLPI